jgi:hypothetical protein
LQAPFGKLNRDEAYFLAWRSSFCLSLTFPISSLIGLSLFTRIECLLQSAGTPVHLQAHLRRRVRRFVEIIVATCKGFDVQECLDRKATRRIRDRMNANFRSAPRDIAI